MTPRLPAPVVLCTRWLIRGALLAFPAEARRLNTAALETAVLDAAHDALRTGGWPGLIWTVVAETLDVVRAGLGLRMRTGDRRTPTGHKWEGKMGSWVSDVRFAFRGLKRHPGFAVAAVAVLSLGIGASTAIFSVVDGVLLRPLPYPDADRLVLLWQRTGNEPERMIPVAGPDVAVFRERARLFDGFSFLSRVADATLSTGEPTHTRMALVTSDFFDLIGVGAHLGRTFVQDDAVAPGNGPAQPADSGVAQPTSAAPLILSHGFWVRAFGGDERVIGRDVRINGQSATIVGVMPEGFSLLLPPHAGIPRGVDVWSPIQVDLRAFDRTDGRAVDQDSDNSGVVVARLTAGATLAQAQLEMDAISAALRIELPAYEAENLGVEVRAMHDDLTRGARPTLTAVWAAGGFILLIACLNVALLVLARSSSRTSEFALRAALGARRLRITRQIMVENLVLAALGCAAGWLVASFGLDILLRFAPAGLPRLGSVRVDGRALAFAAAAAGAAACFFGGLPGLLTLRASQRSALGSGGGLGSRTRSRMRSAFVIGEVALAVVLLTCGGLLIRTVNELERIRPGFDPEGVLTFSLSLRGSTRYAGPADRARFVKAFEERVEAIPGVEAMGLVGRLPLGGRTWTQPYGLPGQGESLWSENRADFRMVTSHYFTAMGSRLLEGRSFSRDEDLNEDRRVAVIDEKLALRIAPTGSAVGQRIGFPLDGRPVEAEVVGVVEHMRYEDLKADGREAIYVPYRQEASRDVAFSVRSRVDPETVATPIRQALRALDPELTLYDVRPMPAYIRDSIAPTRFALTLVAGFGLVALVSTLIGLYGLIAYTVADRGREIGLRLAIGADGQRVLRDIVLSGMKLVGVGLAVGLVLALLFGSALQGLLFGVRAVDPRSLAAAAALLAVTAAIAIWIPARRAASIDPASALRAE
jgi:putative ABC transport system permease protein